MKCLASLLASFFSSSRFLGAALRFHLSLLLLVSFAPGGLIAPASLSANPQGASSAEAPNCMRDAAPVSVPLCDTTHAEVVVLLASLSYEQQIALLRRLNEAPIAELVRLPGIATARAQRIVEARPFHSLADVLEIPGIGKQTIHGLVQHAQSPSDDNT